ncbi:MAG: HAD family hydrolase [Lachnotalea sp.]
MIKAVFLDFYGTIVCEDGEVISIITERLFETGTVEHKSDIGSFWWNEFQTMCKNSFGDKFQTQRALEQQSLIKTIHKFQSTENANELSNLLFEHWVKPPIFPESKEFFEKCPVPIYIVSNIDREDILGAIHFHDLKPINIFTSEDAKSYKPRKELFELALANTGLEPNQVVHIGDSMSSDIKGASEVGINTIWVNRSKKEVPRNIVAVTNLLEVFDSDFFN